MATDPLDAWFRSLVRALPFIEGVWRTPGLRRYHFHVTFDDAVTQDEVDTAIRRLNEVCNVALWVLGEIHFTLADVPPAATPYTVQVYAR